MAGVTLTASRHQVNELVPGARLSKGRLASARAVRNGLKGLSEASTEITVPSGPDGSLFPGRTPGNWGCSRPASKPANGGFQECVCRFRGNPFKQPLVTAICRRQRPNSLRSILRQARLMARQVLDRALARRGFPSGICIEPRGESARGPLRTAPWTGRRVGEPTEGSGHQLLRFGSPCYIVHRRCPTFRRV